MRHVLSEVLATQAALIVGIVVIGLLVTLLMAISCQNAYIP